MARPQRVVRELREGYAVARARLRPLVAAKMTSIVQARVMPSSTVLTFADPYDYQKSVRRADLQVFVAAPGSFEAKLTRVDLPSLWMQRGRLNLPAVTHTVGHPDRSAIVFLADTDQKPMLNSGIEVFPGDIVCYSPGSEHHLRTSENYHCCAMSLTAEDLAAFGRVLVGRELTPPGVTRVVRPPPALMSRLLSLRKAADDLATTAPDILEHPEVAKAVEQELVRAMVACLTDPLAEASYRSNRQRLAIMRRLERILEDRRDEPLYITDVCAAIGVTDRTLRLHCQEHLGMSPHRYLWLRRMNLARRALALTDSRAKTVTEIANDYGFGELGRFAVMYRKLFGESPSVTLHRAPDDRLS